MFFFLKAQTKYGLILKHLIKFQVNIRIWELQDNTMEEDITEKIRL